MFEPGDVLLEIRDTYLADDRPWIVGFSGGKDSTALVQLVWTMVADLPRSFRRKPVYLVASDTLVELPPVADHLSHTIEALNKAAMRDGLPIEAVRVIPELKDRFFVCLIGRGYPAPNRWFRWCTDRLKIRPATRFIKERIADSGEVVILLGARRSESRDRAASLARHSSGQGNLRRHAQLREALVYTPIADLDTEDVWFYLLNHRPPWGGSHSALWKLYGEASGGDCPFIIDKYMPSCGGSRFGCWVCTVVKHDRALRGLVENGHAHLRPLLEYRDWLAEFRNDLSAREHRRRNGRPGPGPFTLNARRVLLGRLEAVQGEVGQTLLREEERELISELWRMDGGR